MATEAQLIAALQKADAAGNVDDARALAAEIRKMRAGQSASVARPEQPGLMQRAVSANADFNPVVAAGEGALNLASSAIAAPVAGYAGILSGGDAGVVNRVAEAMTYQPRGRGGQNVAAGVAYPFQKIAEGAHAVGGAVSEATGSPALGAGVNTAIQALPAVLLRGRGAKPAAPVGDAAARAQAYVSGSTGLDWNALSAPVKAQLTEIAKEAGALERLDPVALERQARLESLPVAVPATRGQLTRDPVQLRNEGNVSATEAGKPIRDIHDAANDALLQNLRMLKEKVGGKAAAETPEQTGASVQGALRAKLEAKKAEVSDLYKAAEQAGELQAPASTRALGKMYVETVDKAKLSWVKDWLVERKSPKATLAELEVLRKEAVGKAMAGGEEGFYAGKVIRAIDEATEGVGGAAYKKARAARKQQALEFEDQGAIARLVENKSRTDPATPLEQTWRKTVLSGSIQDLSAVRKSLLSSRGGWQAWKDLRAQTAQFIIDEATKGVGTRANGSPNITPASLQRAVKSVGPEKIDMLFGRGAAKTLNEIVKATGDVKTLPPSAAVGSSTFANILTFLERGIGKVPVLGDTAAGVVRGAAKLREMGQAGREVSLAQSTPLAEGMNAAAQMGRNRNALASLGEAAPYAGLTLEERRRNYFGNP